jgi:hypothetical protein
VAKSIFIHRYEGSNEATKPTQKASSTFSIMRMLLSGNTLQLGTETSHESLFMKIGIPELRPQDYDGIYFPFILMVISFSVIVLFSSKKNKNI